MKKSLIALATMAVCAAGMATTTRARTRDVAFQFRMGAGFPGDINRVHPFSAIPALMDTTDPIRAYGDPCLFTATGKIRGFKAGDASTVIKGLLVRSYPTQQQSGGMAASFGNAVPGAGLGPLDYLEDGFMMVQCSDFAANPPVKGGAVFVRIAATSGLKLQGKLHAAADSANTLAITNATWSSNADANGIAEIRIRAA